MNKITNALGRQVPDMINGQKHIPFQGIGQHKPSGRSTGRPIRTCAEFEKDKVVTSLEKALLLCGLRDGMTISTHHHFRDGDLLANQIFDIAAQAGVQNLRWFPSAAFPCHEPIIKHLESGVIHHIEGSMNGRLGDFCSSGKMIGTAILRSHGGRYQAVQDGEVKIDIAVIAAPSADSFGNCNGAMGSSACGPLGYAEADAFYADKVIVVTDNLLPFPCYPWHIQGQCVDYVVKVDKIGIPELIVSGSTQITKSPDRLRIAKLAAEFVNTAGLIKDGFSFQTGAGGISLAFTQYLEKIMKEQKIKASFYLGGSNQLPVNMLEEGYIKYIIDIQAFDLAAVRSVAQNPNHIACGPFTTYNYHGKGNFNFLTDIVVLGATQVDVNFNANVVTHSDGKLKHGIGGWQDCLNAKNTIIAVPSFRDRIPVIVKNVTTLCGPGDLVDVVITERGICINPRRLDMLEKAKDGHLPILDIHDLQKTVENICGPPAPPPLSDKIVAIVKWVDGTLLDSIYQFDSTELQAIVFNNQ